MGCDGGWPRTPWADAASQARACLCVALLTRWHACNHAVPQAFTASKETTRMQQHIQWGLTWLIKAHTTSSAKAASNVLVGQVRAWQGSRRMHACTPQPQTCCWVTACPSLCRLVTLRPSGACGPGQRTRQQPTTSPGRCTSSAAADQVGRRTAECGWYGVHKGLRLATYKACCLSSNPVRCQAWASSSCCRNHRCTLPGAGGDIAGQVVAAMMAAAATTTLAPAAATDVSTRANNLYAFAKAYSKPWVSLHACCSACCD